MHEYRAVLFDMDGVLIDTEPPWQTLWETEVFVDARDGEPSLEDVTGRSYTESVRELDERYDLARNFEHYETLLEERASGLYAEEAAGHPTVHDLFETVRSRGLAIGVVSSSPRDWIETVVDRFGLCPLDCLQSAMEAQGPGKPAPDVYEHAAAELGVEPAECVVIEDSANGVRAASEAGARVIRFALDGSAEAMPEADFVADDPADLERILLALLEDETE